MSELGAVDVSRRSARPSHAGYYVNRSMRRLYIHIYVYASRHSGRRSADRDVLTGSHQLEGTRGRDNFDSTGSRQSFDSTGSGTIISEGWSPGLRERGARLGFD